MAARVGAGLEHVDVVAGPMQLGGGDQAGDPGADHGDPLSPPHAAHARSPLERPRQRRAR